MLVTNPRLNGNRQVPLCFDKVTNRTPGVRGNFVGTARGHHHRGADSAKGERDSSRGDIDGHINGIFATDSEHGGRAGSFDKGHGGCRLSSMTLCRFRRVWGRSRSEN